MRNKIWGVIGILWGGAVCLSPLFREIPDGSRPYNTGQAFGFLLGMAMFVAGVYYVFVRDAKEKE